MKGVSAMNQVLGLAPGTPIGSDGRRYVITHILSLEAVLAKDQETGRSVELKLSDIAPPQSFVRQKNEAKDLTLIEEKDWASAELWFSRIQPLLCSPRTTAMVKAVAHEAGVHLATVYRKLALYEQRGRVSDLTPLKPNGGKGHGRLAPEAEVIVGSLVKEIYLNKQKRSIKKTADEISRSFVHAELKPPHYNTIRNRILAVSEKERDKERLGPKTASEKHDSFSGHFPGADWPLAVVQIDHTKFDIMLVDDIHRLCIGRPWVTLAIDVFSRMVVGIYISLEPPNSMSVGLCIVHAVLSKDQWLTRLGLETSWPCWGVMQRIHADNGREFRGNMLQRACKEYSIDLEWRPVKTPHYGAHIERLLGTFNQEIHALPGTTFSSPTLRGEYDSESLAVMTMAEFEKWIVTYITGVYHQREHGSLKTSPLQQYEKGILGTNEMAGRGLPRRIVDEDRLRLDLMPFFERAVQSYGVVVDEVHYYSDVLRRYVNAKETGQSRKKRKFTFRRDPRDISTLYFYDPEVKDYFRIPYRDTARSPMSIWEFREARRRLEKEGVKEINEGLIFRSYEQMRSIEEQAKTETKHIRRKKQQRQHHQQIYRPKEKALTGTEPSEGADAFPIVQPFAELEELLC
jgi:putative transposase